ncbi:MAG: hypothetical protein IT577_15075 [Verrucomicrobiae bacterium]|nr:hypothetical protein [Verrucomicrobiae bacterium]
MAPSSDPTRPTLARLFPYAVYTAAMAGTSALVWRTARPAWLILSAVTYLVLMAVQVCLDFLAASDAHADVTREHCGWRDLQWTMPIALLCATPIPVLGACLIVSGGAFAAACLVIACPVVARLLYDRARRTSPPPHR